ncbi:tetratricopeptide repeat protein [Prosthecomicrobium sp. N25]|uniref:tetratricopeptide repeat protein n=1 Tax=Prosthecomicrobium sp. N25 TaxID=3129254 RepID=UPI003077BF6F
MRLSSHSLIAAGLSAGLLLGAAAAGAQTLPPDHPPVPQDRVPQGDAADLPEPREPPTVTLDDLFDRLKKAKRPEAAASVSREIEARWLASGSDTVDLLMIRALTAIKAKDMALAMDLLDAIVTLKPDYVEGWNKRATLHYSRKDLGRSLADIEMTLRLEPRHYGALYGLATVFKDLGQKDKALDAYRKVLALNPQMPNVEKEIKELATEVEGRDL